MNRSGRGGGHGRGGGGGRSFGGRGSGVCHQWRDTGTCRFGNNCKFAHIGAGRSGGQQGAGSSAPRIKRSSDDITNFIKHLAAVPRQKLDRELAASELLWKRCWQDHETLNASAKRKLLEILANTPGSSAVDPPPIHLCKKLAVTFMKEHSAGDGVVLSASKTVLDAVTRLLQFEWDCTRNEVVEGLEQIILEAESKLDKRNKEHRNVGSRLMEVLEDLEKPWRVKMRELHEASASTLTEESSQALTFADWKSADINWLCNPTFFAPSCCPKMQVGDRGVYESSAHYLDTLHQLWVAMTFSDGHAALAPHCRSRTQNGCCNNALWPIGGSGHKVKNFKCRSSGCSRPVEVACRIPSHDALCGDCAGRSVSRHLQGPGSSASTHVYDCKVKSVDPDGIIYLQEFRSRNPPPSIHWRTTKRLSPPNLVGIVRIRAKGIPLNKSDKVIWGEVTYHGHNRDEDRRRQNGDLAINIASIYPVDPDLFEENSFVVVVDCMSFVPEWIPVLRAVESQKNSRLPFDNGKHLNLWKNDPVSFSSCVESAAPDAVFNAPRASVIEEMVRESLLEPIREIRLDPSLLDELVVKLEKLVNETTLDKHQFVSFVDSLRNPVHLTQGPPGTGKSYLGVVLVRALIIIRSLWIRKSKTAGSPPILVLSYKNLAIDNFLVDLVKAEPLRNQLIRIGGSCKDPRLAQFSERNTYHSDSEVKTTRAIVERLNRLRDSIQANLSGSVASFLSYKTLMFLEGDEKARRQAGNKATEFLMESIIRRRLLIDASKDYESDEECTPASVIADLSFMEVDHDRQACRQLKRLVENPASASYVASLVEDRLHYHDQHWGDLLLMWLYGKIPLPRCVHGRGESETCNALALSPDIPLCDEHRCLFEIDVSGRCTSPCAGRGSYCADHCCSNALCHARRLDGPHKYCGSHACRKCVQLAIPARPALDKPPRNVCELHPLCTFPSCPEYCIPEGIYCTEHNVVKCMATTKKGKPCRGEPLSVYKPFCRDHLHLARSMKFDSVSMDYDSDSDDSSRSTEAGPPIVKEERSKCAAKTKKGQACRGWPMAGSIFCYDHAPPASSESTDFSAKVIEVPPSPKIKSGINGDEEPDEGKSVASRMLSSHIVAGAPGDESVASSNSSGTAPVRDEALLKSAGEVDEIDFNEEEEGENLQHLRDVFEIDDDDDENSLETLDQADDFEMSGDDASSNASFYSASQNLNLLEPTEFTWDLTLEQRWRACQSLMEDLRVRMNGAQLRVKQALIVARSEHHRAKTRAKSRVYENKAVIGGTMVGCIARLDSIRATRPFAVVVEEASEVLEPLLFSCLNESTLKLEMIGDHRQLFPSVMSRFDFELCNKINVSMFQRLIEAPDGHTIPSTVLSVQRRMRKNICDLTREYYADVVEIKDHESCDLQVIGQRSVNSSGAAVVKSASTCGREVPGIGPHIFLWTHCGQQKRAHIGISRINDTEAHMAAALAAYCVACGVPRSSIAILTPYKGQLMLIRDKLLKDPKYSSARLLSRDPQEEDVCRVSTVDRFQGDEEDVIICSLVVDETSRTGFVKLKNRMVVLLSRARLGLYILANDGFLGNQSIPKHWNRTLELLEAPGSNDSSSKSIEASDVYRGPRSGNALPVCCAIHRHITMTASSADSLKTNFCVELCRAPLSCGHPCSLRCHWPNTAHNTNCIASLDSPCQRHGGIITCHQAFLHASKLPSQTDYTSVLNFYRCPKEVELSLPCGHVQRLACWEELEIAEGKRSLPVCNRKSPTPFTFLSCGHTRAVSCAEMKRYTENPSSVRCEQEGDYEAPCGHKKRMKCWEIDQILSGSKIFDCRDKVLEVLPRCGHKHKLPCGVAHSLLQWTGENCSEIGKIYEGHNYGPQDYTCNKKVTIIRECGHNVELSCSEAFSRALSLPACRTQVKTRHPACGHFCTIACSDMKVLKNLTFPDSIQEYVEGSLPSYPALSIPLPQCNEKVTLVRKCGHRHDITCCEVRKPLPGCTETVKLRSPFCAHEVDVRCNQAPEFQKEIWSSEVFSVLCNERMIQQSADSIRDVAQLGPEVLQAFCQCRDLTTIVMKVCGHEKAVPCADFVSSRISADCLECTELVTIRLECGHLLEATCAESQRFKAGMIKLPCKEMRPEKCWNFGVCRQILQVNCSFEGIAACGQLVPWTCSTGQHTFSIKQCVEGTPQECPHCSFDALQTAIQEPQPIDVLRMASMFECLPDSSMELLNEDKNFARKEGRLLQQYQSFVEDFSDWDRPLFTLQRIPCFRHLKNEISTTFDPKLFVKNVASMFGIITKVLTEANLLKLAETAKQESVTLLFGFASVARTKVNLSWKSLPPRKKRGAMFRALLNDNYDSMLYSERGFTNLVVWDPYPMVALFRITVTKEQLFGLATSASKIFGDLPSPDPQSISFEPPPHDIVTSFALFDSDKGGENDDDDDDSDAASLQHEQDKSVSQALFGTLLEGFQVDLHWSGGICSSGVLVPNVESDLMEKMKFANSSASPFKAVQLLKNLLSQLDGRESALLHLLLAAELIDLDPERAKDHLRHFVAISRKSVATRIHPWSLIVAARLGEPTRAKQILSTFLVLFPSQEHLLLESELQLVRGDSSQKLDAAPGWSELLKDQWRELQDRYPLETRSDAMEEMLAMTGLRKVKEEALRIWNSALQLRKMDPEARKNNTMTANYIFAGNPGSGKTSVARLFAAILCDSGVREKNVIEELTAQSAKDGGADEFKKSVSKAMDGVLFIDEAYDLDPIGDFKGRPIVNELLTLCENNRETISVILAGYEDDFQKKFFSYNDGLQSRFRMCHFEDFDENELQSIWTDLRIKKGWDEEEGVCRVLVKRLMKRAGRKGFANAREVRTRLEEATQSAMTRLGHDFSMDKMKLEIKDVLGDDPRLSNEKLQRVMKEIQQKIGWGRVKKSMTELVELCGVNYRLELLGKPPLDIFLNRLFIGNPGTGKTTCAKLYGRLLKELGFLSNGEVVSTTASDFVGSVVGESQSNTSRILKNAQGKVLIIDEAYVLDDNMYGKQVLDTLVEKVQGGPSDDIAVLLLGYEEQMLAMLRNQNPGLARRFPKDHAFYFDDYTDDELLKIVNLNLKTNDIKSSLEFQMKALDVLRQQRSQANFGNAGAAELLVKGAMLRSAERLGPSFSGTLLLEDVDIDDPGTARAEKDADPLQQLDGLYRMEMVKAKLESMKKTWAVSKQDGDEAPNLGHFVFTGSPGTGKTTVARTIARVLFSLGLLPSEKIVETSALELTADYLGQTKTKVNEALSEAKGGVLFIDEAYNLGFGPYGKEACDTIVQAMTSENFKDIVIVIAGYPYEIDQMLQSNAGLKSRFTNFFEFPDWQPDDCKSFFMMLSEKKKFALGDGVLDEVQRGCAELMTLDGWGNGRDVTKLWEQVKSNRDVRVYDSKEMEKVICLNDVQYALSQMLKARRPKIPKPGQHARTNDMYQDAATESLEERESRQEPKYLKSEGLEQAEVTEEDDCISEVDEDEASSTAGDSHACTSKEEARDEGVPDEIWDALQEAKKRDRERLAELQREEEAYQQFLVDQEKAEIEAQRRFEEEQERIRQQLEREEQERALREAEEAERRRKHEAELKRKRLEEEHQRRLEEERQRVETMKRLQTIMPCPMGFSWHKMGGGWRCGGGSHFVSDAELRKRFGADL